MRDFFIFISFFFLNSAEIFIFISLIVYLVTFNTKNNLYFLTYMLTGMSNTSQYIKCVVRKQTFSHLAKLLYVIIMLLLYYN